MYKYAKLRGRIVEKFGTIEAFSKAIGQSAVTVSKKLNGHVQFTQKDIALWANTLDIPPSAYILYFFN